MSSGQARARQHINSFRAARNLPDDDVIDANNLNLQDLAHALALTSSELYADSFHFIWEIIQNNDDAEYRSQEPRLEITVTDNSLHAWSNQVGFSKTDVDSICGIGRSSKKNKADTIGEKGIGFKSLFSVANKVTIHSEPYHFKFDTTTSLGNLGMIVPTWVGQPIRVIGSDFTIPAEGTTVTLHFKAQTDMKSLTDKLRELDLSFLIFCRRLKKVHVCYKGKFTPVSKVGKLYDQTGNIITLQTTSLRYPAPAEWRFRLFSNELKDMPHQPERSQQRTSTIRLAFPLLTDWKEGLWNEKTYAFMPMGQFGFSFLIHANFILTANRGEVVHTHAWNIRLRSGLVDLIHSAIVWFATSTDSPAIFQWPHYVECLFSIHDNFFRPLAVDARERLRTTPLLATHVGNPDFFQKPGLAMMVPVTFMFDGRLILDGNRAAIKSVRQGYTTDQVKKHTLQKLGVREFGCDDFLSELGHMVLHETAAFRAKPSQWHSTVAAVLVSQFQSTTAFFNACGKLALVPLESGEWVTSTTASLFLPGGKMQDLPSNLTIKLVETAASRDKTRRQLFEKLGIRACTKEQICRAILHNSSVHSTIKGTVAELRFLFQCNYKPKPNDVFQFDSESGYGSDPAIHIHFGVIGSAIRKQLGPVSAQLRWLRSEYVDIADNQQLESFVAWLQDWPQLRLWPEMCQEHRLTLCMRTFMILQGSKSFFAYLWLMVTNGGVLPMHDGLWRQHMSDLKVSTDRGSKRLCETALPGVASLSGGIVPSLDIPEPTDPIWLFLGEFGVLTSVDARFLLQQLRDIVSVDHVVSLDETVSRIYLDLGKFNADEAMIRKAFETEDLTYLGNNRWVKSPTCRWKAKYSCTAFPLLSQKYEHCSSLFKQILGVRSADMADLLEEFQAWVVITSSGHVDVRTGETIYQLLLELNKMLLVNPATVIQLDYMKRIRMFPTLSMNSDAGSTSVHVRKSTDSFWIGDIPWLQKRFSGMVPLLSPVHGSSTKDLDAVFKTLEMDGMRLTRCAFSEFASEGLPDGTDEKLAQVLLRKVPYIISILKHLKETNDNQKEFIAQLTNLRIERVKGIKIRRYVKIGSLKVYGTDEEGEICLKPGAGELIIHIDPELQGSDVFDSLAEHFCNYWNLKDENKQLVYKVLNSTSPKRFTEAFERAGIAIPDNDNLSTQSIVSGQTTQPISVDSHMASSSVKPAMLVPSVQARQIDTVDISDDDDDDDDDSVKEVNPQSMRTNPRYSATKADPASTFQWKSQTVDLCAIDDTPVELSFLTGKESSSTSFSHRVLNEGDVKMYDTPPAQGRDRPIPTNAYYGRTRGTVTTSSPTVQPNISHGTPTNITPATVHQSVQSSILHASNSLHEPPQDYGFSSGYGKKRKLDNDPSSSTQGETVKHEIGRAGERLVYEFLSRTLGRSFSHLHWTSRNRQMFFPAEPFTGEEWMFSDFTYKDSDGKLSNYFRTSLRDYFPPSNPLTQPTYHLEVKTSLEGIGRPAVMSNNQIQMARRFSRAYRPDGIVPQDDVYVLVRVFDLDKGNPPAPKICFYPDPWDLICRGKLLIEGDEGLYVRPP